MYVGHYAASLALKKYDPKISLGWLFIGVQLVDIFFFPFVLVGIEKMTIIEHYTATNHFRLDYMPFTHSLLSAFVWAFMGFAVFKWLLNSGATAATAMALAIASHWLVDLPVHTPDLPLWSDSSPKLGFGLWNYRNAAFITEAGILLLGLWVYLKAIAPCTTFKRYGMIAFVIFMILVQASQVYAEPVFLDKTTLCLMAVFSYFLFAGIAHWLDKKE